jgi:predicted ATP-dependent protease
MGRRLALVAGILCLATGAWAQTNSAQEEAEFLKGREAYLRHDYGEAAARFEAMTNPKSEHVLHSPTRLEHAYMYLGATYLEQRRTSDAYDAFRTLLLDAARRGVEYEPDPTTFSREIIDEYHNARLKYRSEILAEKERKAREEQERIEREAKEKERQKRYLAALEKQAGEEIVTTKRHRLLAFVPFGVGQFQNGQPALGWVFLGAESALLAASAITWGVFLYNKNQRDYFATLATGPNPSPTAQYFRDRYWERMNAAIYVDYALVIGFGVTAIAGMVQANLAFVPETTQVKPRPLPQVTYSVGPASIGIRGTF